MSGIDIKKVSFFIIDFSQGGGVEKVTSDLMTLMLENSIPATEIVSLYQSQKEPMVQYPLNSKIFVLNPKSKNDIEEKVYHYLIENKPDAFIFQGDNMTISLAILKAAKKAGIRAIPQYHGSPYAYLLKFSDALKSNGIKKLWAGIVYPFKKNKLKQYLNAIDEKLVCVSFGAAEELKKLFSNPALQKKLATIHNPIHLNFENSAVKEKKIIFVSRLETKHKNAFLIIKTWKLISNKYPDWRLQIFGTGSLENKMKDFAKENKIENIDFRGFTKDINSELAKTSIAVSTSNSEGFSMAIAESLSNKNAACVTKSYGGVGDMVIHHTTGLVSGLNDEKELAKNIAYLIDNDEQRNTFAEAGYERMKYLYHLNTIDEWKKLLYK